MFRSRSSISLTHVLFSHRLHCQDAGGYVSDYISTCEGYTCSLLYSPVDRGHNVTTAHHCLPASCNYISLLAFVLIVFSGVNRALAEREDIQNPACSSYFLCLFLRGTHDRGTALANRQNLSESYLNRHLRGGLSSIIRNYGRAHRNYRAIPKGRLPAGRKYCQARPVH